MYSPHAPGAPSGGSRERAPWRKSLARSYITRSSILPAGVTPDWGLAQLEGDVGAKTCGRMLMARVLLIEDDRETAKEIMAELVDRGFEVDWAATGIEGLDKARSGEPHVMIVDRLLPGMDGLTIIEA